MSDGFYAGWGLRSDTLLSLKRVWKSQSQHQSRSLVLRNHETVSRARQTLKLSNEDGLVDLAILVARGTMERLTTDQTKQLGDTLSNPFFRHIAGTVLAFLNYEQPFHLPDIDAVLSDQSTAALWEAEDRISLVGKRLLDVPAYAENLEQAFALIFHPIVEQYPDLLVSYDDDAASISYSGSVLETLTDLPAIVERAIQIPFAPEFDQLEQTDRLRDRLEYNLLVASGGIPGEVLSPRSMKMPGKAGAMPPSQLVDLYLGGTPLQNAFDYQVPIRLPRKTRFEHHHIVAGSGHGKTQTLQDLIAHDLPLVATGDASVIVIDSQGDLINRISHMAAFAEGGALADRIVLIDPTDVEYPVALNLFDIGLERINQYSQLDRERMINGVLELYDFVLGSLLDAQMTQKQSVIFRYITRLMLHIPDATIETLRDLLDEGGAARHCTHIERLQGSARAFFQTEFDSREFVQTKRQVLRRLWGILENQSFERMFLHPRNKLDLFSEMNSGKIILINTAKDLLKEEGTQIFGRFFIAMIAQAAQERSVIPEDERMPTFVYVDEAQDYFDRNIGIILSQARKYRVGMVLAHQYLGQLDSKLQESVFANTSIKFAGGVSSKDARTLAPEMRTNAEFIEQQETLEFAAYIRGTTRNAASIRIEPGTLERQQRMTSAQFEEMRSRMRERYAVHYESLRDPLSRGEGLSDDTDSPTGERQTNSAVAVRKDNVAKGPSDALSGDALPWD